MAKSKAKSGYGKGQKIEDSKPKEDPRTKKKGKKK
jgi:hypothetical protein